MRFKNYAAPPIRYDWPTGLYSRWYLEARTYEECADAFRAGRPVFLVRITAGTPRAGKLLVAWLRTGLDAGAVAGVVSPGVFGVLLTETSRRAVVRMLDEARCEVEAPFVAAIAQFPDDGLTFENLLRRAVVEETEAALAAA